MGSESVGETPDGESAAPVKPYVGTCCYAGCKVQHLHPVTGVPPDYHYVTKDGPQPRWNAPNYRRPGNDPTKWWYRVDEIARTANVEPSTVLDWIHRDGLPAGRAPGGRLWLIKGCDLEEFLRNTKRAYPRGR